MYDFRSDLNLTKDSADRILSGRAFHRNGAEKEKVFSPSKDEVLGTVNCLELVERRFLEGIYSEMRFCKYLGARS